MSTYNYIPKVTINETEYNRLRKEGREKEQLKDRLRRKENDIARLNTKINRRVSEVKNKMNKRIDKLNDLNNNLSKDLRNLNIEFNNERKRSKKDINRLNSDMSKMKSEHNKDMKNLNTKMNKMNSELNLRITSLDKKVDAIEEEIYEEINEFKQDTKEALTKQKREFNNKITTIVNSIKAKETSQKNLALNWLKDLDIVIKMIDVLDHEKYKPSQLNKLKSQMEMAKGNISNNVYEAAIASIQERYIEANELFNEVNYLQKEFEELQTMALNYVDELRVLLDTQRKVKMEIRGEDVDVDVNKWTFKGITKSEEELNSLTKNIENKSTSIEDMYKIVSRIQEMFKETKELPQKAKDNIILSELRIDMAETIEDSLEEAGFEMVDNTFESGDTRKSLVLKFQNSSDEEIITIIKPEQNLSNTLNIMFESIDNEKYKNYRLNKILDKLKTKGIDVGNFKCTDSTTRSDYYEEVSNFDKVEKKGLPCES